MNQSDDPHGIGAYYKRKDEERRAAYKIWEHAKADGADEATLRKLWEKMLDAGYCGD